MSRHCNDKCIICSKYLQYGHKTDYCLNCLNIKRNNDKLKIWFDSGDTGCSVQTTLRNCIRTYILEKQNHKCAICGIVDVWNNKPLRFILDHIDGDASNNDESNLRLICHNCDSQLLTYKSRNKNSKRKHRLLPKLKVKPVYKIDLSNNEIIAIYDSVKQASIDCDISVYRIYDVVNGRRKSAGGFAWKYSNL